jgi:hypothetical protein
MSAAGHMALDTMGEVWYHTGYECSVTPMEEWQSQAVPHEYYMVERSGSSILPKKGLDSKWTEPGKEVVWLCPKSGPDNQVERTPFRPRALTSRGRALHSGLSRDSEFVA